MDEVGFLAELSEVSDSETESEILGRVDALSLQLDDMLARPEDSMPAILCFQHGTGGTESCAWTEMIMRMCAKFAGRRGLKHEILDIQHNEPEGVRSAMVRFMGPNAYGLMKHETGVHRLSRVSPFDKNDRRQTSFCQVEAWPERAPEGPFEIPEDEIEEWTCCGGGPGGQKINKTEVVVCVRHKPTGLVVRCQAGRSQSANRAMARDILQSRLLEEKERKEEEERKRLRGEAPEIAFGSQARTYVLSQGRMVVDHRTGKKTSEPHRVLDGELELIRL